MRTPPLTPLADRRAEGQRRVRAAGLRAGGRAPYGLVLVRILVGGRPRTTLALGDRREVATLRALARLLHRLGGEDPRAVAQALNAQGHRRRGRRWTAQAVRRALATTAYARWVPGWPETGGVEGAMTVGGSSVSTAENRTLRPTQPSEEVNQDDRREQRTNTESYELTLIQPSQATSGDGLVRRLRCGRCGCTMRQRVTSAKVGEPRRYLACKSGDRGRPCGARWWRREVLEGLLTGELGHDQGGLIGVGEAAVSLIPSAPAARPTPFEEGLMEHIVALKSQLDRVEAQLAGFSEARSPTEALLERVLGALERMEARGSDETKAVAKRGAEEEHERGGDDGLGALTALVVAALRALVMLVPELPVTGTVAAKILGIQRAKLDGGDVAMVPLGRALVAPFGLWLAKAFTLVPPPPGLGLLIGAQVRAGGVEERGWKRRRRGVAANLGNSG